MSAAAAPFVFAVIALFGTFMTVLGGTAIWVSRAR
jgi:hypothetical protein